jgi:hypothetical protein
LATGFALFHHQQSQAEAVKNQDEAPDMRLGQKELVKGRINNARVYSNVKRESRTRG